MPVSLLPECMCVLYIRRWKSGQYMFVWAYRYIARVRVLEALEIEYGVTTVQVMQKRFNV
jgi:hypothetical protein